MYSAVSVQPASSQAEYNPPDDLPVTHDRDRSTSRRPVLLARVDAEAVVEGRCHVVGRDAVALRGGLAPRIARADDLASFHPASRKQHEHRPRVMVPSGTLAADPRRPPELTGH